MNKFTLAALSVLALSACVKHTEAPAASDSITVKVNQKTAGISPDMYGIFIEEINNGLDGGLIAEMVRNRSFEDLEMPEGYHAEGDLLVTPLQYHHIRGEMVQTTHPWTADPVPGWTLEGNASMALTKDAPMFESAPNSLKVSVDGKAVLTNEGFWGMCFQKGRKYELRVIVKPCEGSRITARLVGADGEVLAEAPVEASGTGEWNDVRLVVCPRAGSDGSSLALAVEGSGEVSFDYVSLMPEDRFACRSGKLPLRKDVAQMLADMHPKFIRWPGGCVVEGISLSDRFEWKKSLGDPASRQGNYNPWGYHCSHIFGYHEMLCFCEAIGARALFVCNAGMSCNGRQGELCGEDEIPFYVDECLDAIEYAIGPVDSEWGALRAQAGHPEPFPLGYIEVGNENEGPEYERHYNIFHKAIKEKYPELTVICNNGMFGKGSIEETDMIDPHWYVKPGFFFQNTHLFDNVERGGYTAYVGEYGVNTDVGNGCMEGALAEAAWIGGMERNGDFVRMCSFAPLLENPNGRFWPVNLIWVNSSDVLGRSSYYVQKMAATNRPDYNVVCSAYENKVEADDYKPGRITLGTNHTVSEFKDITVTTADGHVNTLDPNAINALKGEWSVDGGVLRQNSLLAEGALCTFDGIYGGSYSIDLKFRRIKGDEGCYIGFAMDDTAGNGYRCSIGGWEDSITSIELVMSGSGFSQESQAGGSVIREGSWQTVHVDVEGSTSTLYIDGRKITTHHMPAESTTYYTAGYDGKNSETVIKVVNRGGEPFPLNVTLEGADKVARRGTVITLAASGGREENDFDNPTRIVPVESRWNGFGKNFTYTLKPYSYTVLRIRTTLADNPFFFDGKPTDKVLDNYLDRAITMNNILTHDYPDKDADIDLIADIGAKFVGRAVCLWGGETVLNDPDWVRRAKAVSARIHAVSPETVMQGCCFEIVTRSVEQVKVPAWAFESLGLPVEDRNFDYDAMLYPDGSYVAHWASEASVPDIRRTETQLWYSCLIGKFVEMGCEGVHLGQTMLVGEQDSDWKAYDGFIAKMHAYHDPHARRHYVMYDAHAGEEGMFTPDGRSVLDYNAFPMRVEETPWNGYLTAQLRPGFTDAMYGTYPHPYLVELDGWGMSSHPGQPSDRTDPDLSFWEQIYVWGYDEETWFYMMPEQQRNDWLRYAYHWIKENDPWCHLQMPATKPISVDNGMMRAIAPTEDVPNALNLAPVIKELWSE